MIKGAIAINKNEVVECSAKKNLQIKDLTGAGDLFAGGFLHGLINNKSTKESLEIGTEMSSKVIQIIGASLIDQIYNNINLFFFLVFSFKTSFSFFWFNNSFSIFFSK